MATNNQSQALMTAQQQTMQTSPVITEMAAFYGMTPASFLNTITRTIMPDGKSTPEQMLAFLTVAKQYKLNPFTKQIYAFPGKGGGVTPIVSVDGWDHLINTHEQYDGVEFEFHWDDGTDGKVPQDKKAKIAAITCKMHRKDLRMPVVITEFFAECVRSTDPWRSHPIRMLRHKALIQCARVAFGFSGIYDEDEAERINEAGGTVIPAGNGPIIDGATGQVTVPNMTKNATADLKQNLAAATQKAAQAQPAAPPAKPAPKPAPTPTPAPPASPEPEWPEEEAPEPDEPEPQPEDVTEEAPARMDWSQAPDPDPTIVPGDGGGLKVWGTVTAIYAPTKAGKGTKMGLKLNDLNLSDWHESHFAFLKNAKGKVCVFLCKENGSYKNVEKIERIGDAEYDCDEQGHCVPVIRQEREEGGDFVGRRDRTGVPIDF